jgi:hypothetical protein
MSMMSLLHEPDGLSQKNAMAYLQALEKTLNPNKFSEFLSVIEDFRNQR